MATSGTKDEAVVATRLDDWRRRLIDLSYRNRLINFRATKASTLSISAPSIHQLTADPDRKRPWQFFLPPEPETDEELDTSESADLVDEALLSAVAAHEPGPDEIVLTEPNPKRITRVLDTLAKRSNSEFQDKAIRTLYLALGFLDWVDPQRGERLSSPLVLVPVELRRQSTAHPYELFFIDDEDTVVNPSLTEKLRRDAGRDVPDDWAWEDKPLADELAEIEEALATTDWSIREEGVLSLFSFQKFVMYRDLLDNEDRVASHPLVVSLARGVLKDATSTAIELPDVDALDEAQPPERALSILDADASQRLCIEAMKRGQSFAIHGPPGTGKSQTIANIIAEAIGAGKSVLFVSEKAAALEVVHRRLLERGLDDLCLLLHGEHAARHEVVMALYRSLTSTDRPRSGMRVNEFKDLARFRELLNETVDALHAPEALFGGRSLRGVLARVATLRGAVTLPGAPAATGAEGEEAQRELQGLLDRFERLASNWAVADPSFPWRGMQTVRFSPDDRARMVDRLTGVRSVLGVLVSVVDEIAGQTGIDEPRSVAAAEQFAALLAHIANRPDAVPADWIEPHRWHEVREAVDDAEGEHERLSAASAQLTRTYEGRDLADMPRELAKSLREGLGRLVEAAELGADWELRLLSGLDAALEFTRNRAAVFAEVQHRASEVAARLGQPEQGLTWKRLEELIELADIAFRSEYRPESNWLARVGLERANDVLRTYRSALAEHAEKWSALGAEYEPAVLELDASNLLRRFREEYESSFARLKPSYRADAKAIKSVRKDGKLPVDVDADLELLLRVQRLRAELDEGAERMQAAFGSYYQGYQSQPAAIEAACENAERIASLMAPNSDLQALSSSTALGSTPDTELAFSADRLRSAVARAMAGFAVLEGIGSSIRPRPQTTISDSEAAVDQIGEALLIVGEPIRELSQAERKAPENVAELRARAEMIEATQAAADAVREREESWERTLALHYAGRATDWDGVRARCDWLEKLESLASVAITPELVLRCYDAQPGPAGERVRSATGNLRAAFAEILSTFDEERQDELLNHLENDPYRQLEQLLDEWERRLDDLGDWAEFRNYSGQLTAEGWGDFLKAMTARGIRADQVTETFELAFWQQRMEALFEADPQLSDDLQGKTMTRFVEQFKALDRKLVETGADRLLEGRNRSRPQQVAIGASGERATLKHEAGKKRRHLPVRKLLAALPTLLSELKPCLMMSPLSVSHFLTPEHRFDLVVFDEASQVPPQDAINCIYRGDQLIAAGDTRQLPPTSFFQISDIDDVNPDDPTAELAEDMESILDSCKALLPEHTLRWHYRSRDEHLIAFSNENIYDGSLITFPAADQQSDDKGVHFIHVADGVYDRGATSTNRVEAMVVADRVLKHLESALDAEAAGRPPRSVGVIAFNTQQATAISEELDRRRLENPAIERYFGRDRLDSVFVKHLEAVQGDERDVILFSVGYGFDSSGTFTMNFGPLNKAGGRRRLNVAVTRARERVEVIASVRSADFNLSDKASSGARLLRDYLHFAEQESGVAPSGDPGEEVGDLEGEVVREIDALGYQTVSNVGIGLFRIDIGVVGKDGRFLLGIETDGESYRLTPTARDRERLRHDVLEGLGWQIHRVWSLDWARNRGAQVEALRDAIAAAERDPTPTPALVDDRRAVVRERQELEVIDLAGSFDPASLPWTARYNTATLPDHSGDFYAFHESPNRKAQKNCVVSLLKVEAPVSESYAIRRLAGAWGLKRAGHRVAAAGKTAIQMAVRAGEAEYRGDFLWRPDQELTTVRIPNPDDPATRRAIDDIPPEELDLAMKQILVISPGAEGDGMLVEVSRVLGFDRTGQRIRDALWASYERVRGEAAEGR